MIFDKKDITLQAEYILITDGGLLQVNKYFLYFYIYSYAIKEYDGIHV